ncbi:sodium-coupled monocarboxylate transporter 1-like isoform X1 [Biomphalaria glabrata]|uniref:Sodium-coupled monocarboxylate transporter 1-like isoform X1 n=1 Tax=Biomphalaria glabrata TaxID=6526 RepID=A0A9W3B3R8_BIOGL|nr:sodium-coupled monocarboxylate transporter 1-like isoform X1 [Biomphalaria glabrata]
MSGNVGLQIADYVVIAVMLFIPLAVGVFFAIKDAKKTNRDEYLFGGRKMSMLPVALSIFATFMSAISMMGIPTEVYYYGAMHTTFQIGFALSFLIGYVTMIPLIYPLHVTSIYQYLRLRFQSELVRNSVLTLAMIQTFFYMAIALLTPALALQAAAGIPFYVSVLIVGSIGTIYTAIGGIKSVVWTDAFQCCIMITGLMVMIGKGFSLVGGADKVWSKAEAGGRTNFLQFSPDPRSRSTWWSTLIGGCFMWLTNVFNQSTTQRVCAMRTMKEAKITFVINFFMCIFYGGFLFAVGIVIYAYFDHIQCDPYNAGLISNKNQLPPYFVLHVLQDLPGMSGLYMSSIFSGALSTLSSGMNALAANTVEDILQRPLRNFTEQRSTLMTKLLVLVYGVLIVVVAYLARTMTGSVAQMTLSVFGACGGPILGVFLLGACFPSGNKYGALVGGALALTLTMWMSVGNQLYGKAPPTLPSPSTDMCFTNESDPFLSEWTTNNSTWHTNASSMNTKVISNQTDVGFSLFLYNITYEWYGCIGTVVSLVVGLLVSLCTCKWQQPTHNARLIFPFLAKVWSLPKVDRETNGKALEKLLDYETQIQAQNNSLMS